MEISPPSLVVSIILVLMVLLILLFIVGTQSSGFVKFLTDCKDQIFGIKCEGSCFQTRRCDKNCAEGYEGTNEISPAGDSWGSGCSSCWECTKKET